MAYGVLCVYTLLEGAEKILWVGARAMADGTHQGGASGSAAVAALAHPRRSAWPWALVPYEALRSMDASSRLPHHPSHAGA